MEVNMHVIAGPETYQVIHACDGTQKLDSRTMQMRTVEYVYHVAGADRGNKATGDCCQRRTASVWYPCNATGTLSLTHYSSIQSVTTLDLPNCIDFLFKASLPHSIFKVCGSTKTVDGACVDGSKLRYIIYSNLDFIGVCKQRVYVEIVGCAEDGASYLYILYSEQLNMYE